MVGAVAPEALAQVERGDVDAALVFSHDWSPPAPAHLACVTITTDPIRLILPAGSTGHDLAALRF